MFEPRELQALLALIARARITGEEAAVTAMLQQKIKHELQKAQAPKIPVPVKPADEEENGDN